MENITHKISTLINALETIKVSGSADITTMSNIFGYLKAWNSEIIHSQKEEEVFKDE